MQEIIAIIFDFDDTLAPDSTSGYLDSIGIEVPLFWQNEVQPLLEDDWDPVPAYLYKMIEQSNSGKISPITQTSLADWGKQIEFYEGVEEVFDRLRDHARTVKHRLSIEFYLISSGIGEILRHTKIAHQFSDIWACDFIYNEAGHISFPKRIVSFTDKTRYLYHIKKGIFGPSSRGKPFDVNRKWNRQHVRIPFDRMIVVGDGYTDIPCFSLIRKQGGVAIGVYDNDNREKWGRAWGFIEDGRVSNLVPADYRNKSALSNSLMMAVESIANKISLVSYTYQG